jgi:O-antigen/teichoic acid export membrane protein
VLTAWLGSGFEASVTPLVLLGATVVFSTTNGILAQYIFARGRPGILAVAQTALGALNLGLTIALLLTVGEIWVAALATLIAESISAVVVLPLVARPLGISARAVSAAWLAPVGAGIVAALPTLVLARAVTDNDSLLGLALVGAVWALAFAAVAWRVALTDSERAAFRRALGRRRTVAAGGSAE